MELKPCPFCGGEAKISHMGPYVGKTSKVECKTCGECSKIFFISMEYAANVMAAEAWNRRANDG